MWPESILLTPPQTDSGPSPTAQMPSLAPPLELLPGDPCLAPSGIPGLSLLSAEVGGLGSPRVGLPRLWMGGSWWGRKATKWIPEASCRETEPAL